MSCKEFEKQILLFTELTSDEQALVTAHLITCEVCSALFESVSHTSNLVRTIGKAVIETEDSSRLTNDIMARIKAEEPQSRSWFDLSFLNAEFSYVKYGLAACSLMLVIFFSVEQLQSPTMGEVVSRNQSKKVVLNRKNFQDQLSKSKTAVNLILANSCKSPFNITKVNEDCLKQRMAINKEL